MNRQTMVKEFNNMVRKLKEEQVQITIENDIQAEVWFHQFKRMLIESKDDLSEDKFNKLVQKFAELDVVIEQANGRIVRRWVDTNTYNGYGK